jgi:hypothetical protein
MPQLGKQGGSTSSLERRVQALESVWRSGERKRCSGPRLAQGSPNLRNHFEELLDELKQIQARAEAAGDDRIALACLRERSRNLEILARLRGELDERAHTNILNVNLDADTAKKIAETYLARQKALEGGDDND